MLWAAMASLAILILWEASGSTAAESPAGPVRHRLDARTAGGYGSQARQRFDGRDTEALRQRMREAVKTIKTSKLCQTSGAEALYELPWYMTIGNPAAGKEHCRRQFRFEVSVR